MKQSRSLLLTAALLSGLAVSCIGTAQAQSDYPDRPIKFIVPYSAGGLPDTVARVIAQRLGDRLGQPIVVDNRPGANGVVAAVAMKAAPADGYTLLVTDGSMFSINPHIYKTLSYDYKRDFIPVSLAARAPLFLTVHASVPVNTLQEFIDLAKAKPGALNYGSSGIGSSHHLTMEALKSAVGINVQHIPYKGTGQSVPALIGGQVQSLFSALPSLSGFVKTGQVKLLATSVGQRSPLAPSIPAIAETVPGFDFGVIIGVLAPTGTPPAVVERISNEIAKVARMPEVIQTLTASGVDPVGGSSAEYDRAILNENAKLAKAIAAAGIKAE